MDRNPEEASFGSPTHLPNVVLSGRRQQQRTDTTASSRSSSLEAALSQNLQLEERLRFEPESVHETPQEKLRRLLSTRSAISTASSFAERQQAAVGGNANFREIGTGSIGKVFEQPGTRWAFKLPLMDRTDKLWNHYIMNLRVQGSFDELGSISGQVEIPRALWFANETSQFWQQNTSLFPDSPTFPRRPRKVLCMERIFPLPEPIRHAIIDVYCATNNVNAAND